MNQNEKELFLSLCEFMAPDKNKLEFLIQKKAATANVLGALFWNRLAGVAYDVLKESELLYMVNREFRTSIQKVYEHNCLYTQSFMECVIYLNAILLPMKGHYVVLKGGVLCAQYPKGYRTSNDIDILIPEKYLSQIEKILVQNGFCQGSLKNGDFQKASRAEIIKSKMLRGETVPYIKKVGLPFFEYMEVDLNFSLDYKNGDQKMVETLVKRSCEYKFDHNAVMSLMPADFFLHLCAHLYKEATTYPWIIMGRDMSLYKYLDIYMLLFQMTASEIDQLTSEAQRVGLEKECFYAVSEVGNLFRGIEKNAELILSKLNCDSNCIVDVIYPEKKISYKYTTYDTKKRFFAESRAKLLQEVKK